MIMKKTFLTLFALIAMGGSAMAGEKPVISVTDVEALPGETVSFSVNLVDGKADTYTAMTLNAYFPTEGFTTTGDYTVASTWKGASCTVGDINPVTGLATMPFASSNTITGSAVDNLVTIEFAVANTVPVGEYEVTLKGTMFEYNADDKDYAEDVTFTVKVVDCITLDENSTKAPIARPNVNVRVKRTINANEWSTICLPFAMTAEQVKTAFGNDVVLKEFTGADSDFDNDDNVVGIKVNFDDANAIEVNHPYVIKVSNNITEFKVNNIVIYPQEDEAYIEFDNGKTGSRRVVYSGFYGTYHAETVVPNECLFLSNNKFWYSTGNTKMKAYRAYFEFLDKLTDKSANTRIDFNFDETTGIKEVHGNASVEGTYDLQGRKVEKPANKGLYIVNGHKVVIK